MQGDDVLSWFSKEIQPVLGATVTRFDEYFPVLLGEDPVLPSVEDSFNEQGNASSDLFVAMNDVSPVPNVVEAFEPGAFRRF